MIVNYIFNNKEIAFIKALYDKKHNKGEWTGMAVDDKFNDLWKDEISSFKSNNLVKKLDSGSQWEYWCYGLKPNIKEINEIVKNYDKI